MGNVGLVLWDFLLVQIIVFDFGKRPCRMPQGHNRIFLIIILILKIILIILFHEIHLIIIPIILILILIPHPIVIILILIIILLRLRPLPPHNRRLKQRRMIPLHHTQHRLDLNLRHGFYINDKFVVLLCLWTGFGQLHRM
jgi:hypothetical protein